jgi:glycosyltransferase involved in cell wall biosynthesis
MPEQLPLVTIAIPTYNRAATFLPHALRSALAQDYPALEILVSDNASTDQTEELMRGFEDPRLRYVRHEQNIGGKPNWTFCVRQARGTYFLLLHDDDLIDSDFVTACIEAAQGRPDLGVIRTGVRVIDGEGRTLREKENLAGGGPFAELFRAWFRGETSFYLANTLWQTRGLQDLDGFHSKTYTFDDVVTLARLAARYGYAGAQAVKASFRRHEANTFAQPQYVMDWAVDCLYLRDLLVELAPPELRDVMRHEATHYLCGKAYRQIFTLPSTRARLAALFRIYRMFNGRRSPTRTFVSIVRSAAAGPFRKVFPRPTAPPG